MNYRHDDIVTTTDGKQHRVLWQTKRCADGLQVELLVKSMVDKHRKAYKIKVKNIEHEQARLPL